MRTHQTELTERVRAEGGDVPGWRVNEASYLPGSDLGCDCFQPRFERAVLHFSLLVDWTFCNCEGSFPFFSTLLLLFVPPSLIQSIKKINNQEKKNTRILPHP